MEFQRIYVGLVVKLSILKKIIFIGLIIGYLNAAFSQATSPVLSIRTDTIHKVGQVVKNTSLFIDSAGNIPIHQIFEASFTPLEDFVDKNKIPEKIVSSTFYLRISLENSADYIKYFYFYPGKLLKGFKIYKSINGGKFAQVNHPPIYSGFIPVSAAKGVRSDYIFELIFFKTGYNQLSAKLIERNHLQEFKNDLYNSLDDKKTGGIILSGMLLMMILVTILNYFITRKIEFLYNSLYSLCMLILIFLSTYLNRSPTWFKGFFLSYLDLILLMVGTIFYILFTRHFLDTNKLHPKLNRFLKLETWAILILMSIYTFLHFTVKGYIIEMHFENVMKIIVLLAGFVYIYLSFVEKNTLMNYLAIGVATQIFFFIISFSFILSGSNADTIFTSPIFYFEIGITCSILFFLLGLFYKNRQELILNIKEQEAMKLEVQKQSFQTELSIYKAQQEERNRISADMHDDLGAGMTSIRLYSELAKSKSADSILPEIEKISSSADELVNNMNAIIWSMNNENDTLTNMVAYIRSYTISYMEDTGIKAIVDLPDELPDIIVNGTIRRNIFLVMKEALQNIVKHSGATEVIIHMNREPEGFSLTIHDNGKGINFDQLRPFSNGLKNMRKRMADVAIDFVLENRNGTYIRLYRKTRQSTAF